MSRLVGRVRKRALAFGFVALIGASAGLSGCSTSSSGALGQRACRLVHRSLALYDKASSDPSSPSAAGDRTKALALLREALAPASRAATSDSTWAPLSATLSESNRVPEGDLVAALRAQCAGIN